MIDAIFESIAQKAVAGSRLHSKLLLDHMRAGEAEARASRIEEYEAFRRIVDKNQERLDAAAAAGLPPPAVYPHPRDVRFGLPSEPVELLGPTSAADAESYRPLVALRDFAISYAAYSLLYHWTGKRSADPDDPDAALPASMMLALVLDRELPPSMQRGIPDAFKALGDAAKQPEAEHRAELLREMQTLGMLPPGKHRDVPRQPKIPAKIVYREFGGTAHDRMCEFVRQRLPRRTADRLLRLLEAPAKGGARA
ncbi:MAG: hypothetical protein RQ833_12320 [Sphingomonadaceae bacterium]|nr:hypothetical protein [Sphingomonadaceae bacterium]